MMRNVVILIVLVVFSCGREEEREPCELNLSYQSREAYNDYLDLVTFGARDLPEACVLAGVPVQDLRMNLKVVADPSPGWFHSLRISDREFDLSEFQLDEGGVELKDMIFDDVGLIHANQKNDVAILFTLPREGFFIPISVSLNY